MDVHWSGIFVVTPLMGTTNIYECVRRTGGHGCAFSHKMIVKHKEW